MKRFHKDLENPHYAEWREFLARTENWSREQIDNYQLSEIRRVVSLAYNNTRGYRRSFDDHGFDPDRQFELSEFRRLPFTEKANFQEHLEDLSIPDRGREYVTTGGSSGIPMGMYRSRAAFGKELASKAHQYHRIGWTEGDKQIVFRGLPIDTPDSTELVEDLCELRCSTYRFLPEQMEIYRQKALDYRPDWIRCYPSAGYLFASFLSENDLEFPKVKGILCASEMLYDFQKQKLQDVFGCRVFSHYGHYEMSVLAGFCEHTDDYHVLPQYGFAELIDDDGQLVTEPGQTGEIVATSFIMDVTPFIRYRTGDLATFKASECEFCGRPFQIWEKIVGRRQEYVVGRDGRLISMTMMNMHDDIYDSFRQIQFFQNIAGKVLLRYVPKDDPSAEHLEEIRRRLAVKLGDDIDVSFEKVSEIATTKRGKHRSLIQELRVDDMALVLD